MSDICVFFATAFRPKFGCSYSKNVPGVRRKINTNWVEFFDLNTFRIECLDLVSVLKATTTLLLQKLKDVVIKLWIESWLTNKLIVRYTDCTDISYLIFFLILIFAESNNKEFITDKSTTALMNLSVMNLSVMNLSMICSAHRWILSMLWLLNEYSMIFKGIG